MKTTKPHWRVKTIGTAVTAEQYHTIGLKAAKADMTVSQYVSHIITKESYPSLFEQGGSIVTVTPSKTKEDEAIIKKIESLKEELKLMTENRDKWKKDWNSRKAKYDKLETEFNEFKNKIGNSIEPIRLRIKSLVDYSVSNCPSFTPDLKDAVKEIEAIQTKLLK